MSTAIYKFPLLGESEAVSMKVSSLVPMLPCGSVLKNLVGAENCLEETARLRRAEILSTDSPLNSQDRAQFLAQSRGLINICYMNE